MLPKINNKKVPYIYTIYIFNLPEKLETLLIIYTFLVETNWKRLEIHVPYYTFVYINYIIKGLYKRFIILTYARVTDRGMSRMTDPAMSRVTDPTKSRGLTGVSHGDLPT